MKYDILISNIEGLFEKDLKNAFGNSTYIFYEVNRS